MALFRVPEGSPICLIAFSLPREPAGPVVLVANRDEFHARAAEPMHWWSGRDVLAGRDVQAGGTWLGVSRTGRIAAVTNFREVPGEPAPRSRGELPLLALDLDEPFRELPVRLAESGSLYGGFNLLVIEGGRALSLSNRGTDVLSPGPGVHAVSNGPLDARWPKTERSRMLLTDALAGGEPNEAVLAALARDTHQPPDDELPSTGLDREVERFLAPCFIRGERYGTRVTTVLRLTGRRLRVAEYRHDTDGEPAGVTRFDEAISST